MGPIEAAMWAAGKAALGTLAEEVTPAVEVSGEKTLPMVTIAPGDRVTIALRNVGTEPLTVAVFIGKPVQP